MNAPSPGWNADPTGRHEYRYWDGSGWTGDVSDNGVTSVDPVDGGGDPTAVVDATRPFASQPGVPAGPPTGYDQGYGSGPVPPVQPVKSGPSTGLIVGLAALAVALIAGIAFLMTSGGDDDDTATGDDTSDSAQAADDPSGDAPSDRSSSDGDLGDLGDLGDASEDEIVDMMATSIVEGSGGQITQEQAECAARAMIDTVGLEAIAEIGASGDGAFDPASTEDGAALLEAVTQCIPMGEDMGSGIGG
jgi:hypothetical protein